VWGEPAGWGGAAKSEGEASVERCITGGERHSSFGEAKPPRALGILWVQPDRWDGTT
jgi:hypothetical protein